MKRTKFIVIFLTILALLSNKSTISFAKTNTTEPDSTSLHAASALLMDGTSGRVLYEKNGYDLLPMASTTKIMTCLYVLTHCDLNETVTVSARAAAAPQVKLGMQKGEQYKLKDLLYSLMLESHNDTAIAIAETAESSVENFCEKMTKEARTMGCKQTVFETPNGLDSDNHHTTAYELALITKEALKLSSFRDIIATPSYSFSTLDGKREITLTNHDAFLNLYPGAIGVKTGFTGKAGYCFVGAAQFDDRLFISVVLGCGWPPHKTWKWEDTKKLMDYGKDNYEFRTLLSPDTYDLPALPVKKGRNKTCRLYLQDSVSFLTKETEKVQIKAKLPDSFTAPVKKNTVVGSVDVYLEDNLIASVPVYVKDSSKRIDFYYCLTHLISLYQNGLTYESL